MVDESERKVPFYEHRVFQGVAAVVGLVAAIWAFSGAPTPWQALADLTKAEKARANTQIILDTSARMGQRFGAGTKLDAAVDAIHDYVIPLELEGLSLRRTGSDCESAGKRLVDFGTDHGDEVVEEAEAVRPEGESSLALAVIAAVSEIIAEGFEGPASMQQVLIISDAPDDECAADGAAEIKRHLERSGVEATFKVVALRATEQGRERMESFVAALGENAEVDFVETDAELEEAVDDRLEQRAAEIESVTDEPLPTQSTATDEPIETTEEPGEGRGEGETGDAASGGVGEGGESGSTGNPDELGSSPSPETNLGSAEGSTFAP